VCVVGFGSCSTDWGARVGQLEPQNVIMREYNPRDPESSRLKFKKWRRTLHQPTMISADCGLRDYCSANNNFYSRWKKSDALKKKLQSYIPCAIALKISSDDPKYNCPVKYLKG
jgi:hypothetical protein